MVAPLMPLPSTRFNSVELPLISERRSDVGGRAESRSAAESNDLIRWQGDEANARLRHRIIPASNRDVPAARRPAWIRFDRVNDVTASHATRAGKNRDP